MKTYKETRQEIKKLILKKGVDNIVCADMNVLCDAGHNLTNIINAINYFKYSPETAKYRG